MLTFLYTVQSSDNSLDLEYHTSNPLNLNSGSIIDTAGIIALLPAVSIIDPLFKLKGFEVRYSKSRELSELCTV